MTGKLLLVLGILSVLGALRRRFSWYLSAQGSLIALGLVSLGLARAGWYRPAAVGGLLLCTSLLLLLLFRAGRFDRLADEVECPRMLAGLLILLSLLYGLFPTYYLLGGRDPGVYLLCSAQLARTGSLEFQLPEMGQMHQKFGERILPDYPGIYNLWAEGVSDDPSQMIPQFMHLFPAIGATAQVLFGLEGLVRVNALIGLLALWSFFMVARELLGCRLAGVLTLAMGLNPAMIWNARITQSEVLAFNLVFLGLYLLLLAYRRGGVGWGVAAGLVLGGGTLNRIDAPLLVVAVLGFVLVAVQGREGSGLRRVAWGVTLGFAVGCALGLVDGFLHSYPYLESHWAHGHLRLLVPAAGVVLVAGMAVLLLPLRWSARLSCGGRSLGGALSLIGVLIAVWFGIGYFWLPARSTNFQDRALVDLSWYVTPVVLLLSLMGWWRLAKDREAALLWLPLASVGGLVTVLYTARPSITQEHIWAARRWLPQVIPCLLLFAGLGGLQLFEWLSARRRWLGQGLMTILLGYYLIVAVWFSAPFLFTPLLADYREGYARLLAHLEAEPSPHPSIATNGHVASVLTFLYGHPTIMLSQFGDRQRKAGGFVGYRFIGLDEYDPAGVQPQKSLSLVGWFLQQSRIERPRKLVPRAYSLSSAVLPPVRFARWRRIEVSATDTRLKTLVGRPDFARGVVASTGREGFLLYGPYLTLEAGVYQVSWLGRIEGGGRVEVAAESGDTLLVQSRIEGKAFPTVRFELKTRATGVEFRVHVDKGARALLEGVVLERIVD